MRQYFAAIMIAAVKAGSLVYRDDIDVSNYRPQWSEYKYAVPYPKGAEPDCSATMISDQVAITAGHCFKKDLKPFEVEMWNGDVYSVSDIRPIDCWDIENMVPNTADIAIFVLDRPIPNAQPGIDFVNVWNGAEDA